MAEEIRLPPAPTQRDLRQRIKVNAEDIAFYAAGWHNGHFSYDDCVAKLNGNAQLIQDDLAAYPSAEP